MMNDLFTPTFGENFKVTLNYPLWIVENPYKLKEEVKRGLLEMADTNDKLSLAYSGGSDSGFILCCLHDLIKEGKLKKDTIEVFQGVFIINDEPQYDMNRAIKFANSLGIDPKIVEINLDKDTDVWTSIWNEASKSNEKYGGLYVVEDDMFAVTLQNYVAGIQDGMVIRDSWGNIPVRNLQIHGGDDTPGITLQMMYQYDPDKNFVEMYAWNNKILSCTISPYGLKKRPINCEPFRSPIDLPANVHPLHPKNVDKLLSKWVIYLQCYPEMTEIFYKFKTDGYSCIGDYGFFKRGLPSRDGRETKTTLKFFEFRKFFSSYPLVSTDMTLPSGELFEIEHLTNYKDYFVT